MIKMAVDNLLEADEVERDLGRLVVNTAKHYSRKVFKGDSEGVYARDFLRTINHYYNNQGPNEPLLNKIAEGLSAYQKKWYNRAANWLKRETSASIGMRLLGVALGVGIPLLVSAYPTSSHVTNNNLVVFGEAIAGLAFFGAHRLRKDKEGNDPTYDLLKRVLHKNQRNIKRYIFLEY